MSLRFRDRISFKLARTGVILAFLIGLLLSCVQLYWDYREQVAAHDAFIKRILAVAQPPASRAVHILDEDLAAEVVNGLLEYHFIKSAEIYDDLGIELARRERDVEPSKSRWITRKITDEFRTYTVPLKVAASQSVEPGRLTITVDRDAALSDFFGRSMFLLASGLIRNMVLVLLLFAAYYFLITKPLVRLAESISRIDPEREDGGKAYVNPRHADDELGLVARVTNNFVSSIRQLLLERRQAEQALIHARDDLEQRVRERTRELQHEVDQRRHAQDALKKANLSLENRVEERTSELRAEIMERKKAEVQLLGAKEAAETANRTKSEFLANMSHELRTPLNAVIGFSTIMTEEMFGPMQNDKYREYAEDILNSSSHLLKLIGDILDVSKIEAGELGLSEEVVDLEDLGQSCLRTVESFLKQGNLNASMDVPDDMPWLYADPVRVRQILLNLLSNAVKFTPDHGDIIVRMAVSNLGGITITVQDTGCGIPKDMIGHVLEPFGQADHVFSRSHDGVGLGLSLTKFLMELHGGTIEIESDVGEGTTVRASFPPERTRIRQGTIATEDHL
ncbi:sensor histidine kinase [Aestuariispira ectoiniformans]|uniref:sensor histidine kinase n=1 Tax=Aestuariispira ectoiniformans TaxID=2775080 RepID=UPI00223C2A8F|nr:ATP-binding protein [Aestuariispira ectoiniformans]